MKSKKIFILLFASIILFNEVVPSFASEDNTAKQNTSISANEQEDSIFIDNNKITVSEDNNTRTSTVVNLKTGEKNYVVYYKKDGKMYSSYTGKTFDVESIEDTDKIDIRNNFNPVSFAYKPGYRSSVTYSNYKFSYAKLANMGTSVVGIAAGIVTFLGTGVNAQVVVPILVKRIVALGSVVMNAVNLKSPSKKHGLVVRVRKTKTYRNDGSLYDLKAEVVSVKRY